MGRPWAMALVGLPLAGALLVLGVQKVVARDTPAASLCRVSKTSSHPVPGRPSFNFGNRRIAVAFPQGARFIAVPDGKPGWAFIQSNGWIRTKLGWFAVDGSPIVTGRRVDGTGPRLRADVGPLSYTTEGTFYPSLLYFPSLGCWRITATVSDARLTAVVNVVRAPRRG